MSVKTTIWHVTTENEEACIKEAAKALVAGEVVAFPTETVYGLGADATNEEAVARIFKAKGRPSDNPLIVHISTMNMLHTLVDNISDEATQLMNAFWPGPLTLILQSKEAVGKNVTAGLSTVGVRMPNHSLALKLITVANKPLAAPSANTSGKPSPTTAEHVQHDMDGKIVGILDGGSCQVGLESTVIDCTSEIPTILRPGGITKEEIEAVIGTVHYDASLHDKSAAPKSPGMKYVHYAPKAPLYIVEGSTSYFTSIINRYKQEGKIVGVLLSSETEGHVAGDVCLTYGSQSEPIQVSQRLYDALRTFDQTNVDIILVESFPKKGLGEAIMNRLQKAAGFVVLKEYND